jgi:DNA-binding GntR family transcriptional regulator
MSLRARAYEMLEEMIITQGLEPGAKVSEMELSQRLGIGRTPVREALQRLAREGLVDIRPREAILILPMTIERLIQLVEFRTAVEPVIVRYALKRADLDQRSHMLQLAKAVEDAAAIGELALYFRVVRELNTVLCESAGNEFLDKSMTSIYALSRQFAYVSYPRLGNLHRAAALHAGILRSVAARDESAADQACRDMVDYLTNFIEEELKSRAEVARAQDVSATR